MRVAEQLAETLKSIEVKHVFSLVGSGNYRLTTALAAGGAQVVLARHEGPATTMADAYSRTTGKVGVVTLHQGCGLTNAGTALVEAAKSHSPLLVLAAAMPPTLPHANLSLDQDTFAGATTALVERIHSPETAGADLVRAHHLASTRRHPVVLNMPIDVLDAEAVTELTPTPPQLSAPGAAEQEVAELVERLMVTRNPVFVAGRGARSAEGAAALRALAEHCGALLATSAVARGLFSSDPWSIDVAGGFATPLCQELMPQADLIVGWGAALNQWTTAHGDLIGETAELVQVDLDPGAIGRHRPIDLGIVGDVVGTAEAALRQLEAQSQRALGWRTDELRDRIRAEGNWNQVPFDDRSTADAIDPRLLSQHLDAMLPTERTVAVDSGNFMAYPAMFLSVRDHVGFCFTQGFQSIGLGLATAIGAAVARPDRLAVAACGDGGLLASLAELETVARLDQSMVVIVYNDDAYGAEVHHFADEPGHELVRFPPTDFAEIARALGLEACTVTTTEDLAPFGEWLAGPREQSFLIDARIADFPAWFLEHAFRQ